MEDAVPRDDKFADAAPTGIPNSNIIQNGHSAINMFCCALLGDVSMGTFYTNMTGAFPVTSLDSM